MVSRVRIAAVACLMASGLIVGGASGALAFASPALDVIAGDDADATGHETADNDGTQTPPDAEPDGEKSDGDKPDGEKPDGEKSDGEKPDGEKSDDAEPDGEKSDGETPDDDQTPGDGEGKPDEGEGEDQGGSDDDGSTPTKEPDPTPTTDPPPPEEEPEPGRCEEKSDDDCGLGWPWWPWPTEPPEPGDGSSRGGADAPSGRPDLPPAMRLPAELLPGTEHAEPAVVDAEPGVGIAASEIPLAPITLPIIVAPTGLGAGGGAPRSLPTEPLPGSPRGSAAQPPAGRQPPLGETGSNVSMPPSSYRVGYTDYLRSAGLSQVVALAGPGLAGMLVLTGAGGLVGYRQAKAGHAVHTGRSARFVN